MSFTSNLKKERRYIILQFLEDSGGSLGLYMLQSALGAALHTVSMDTLQEDAAWLEEQELARLEREDGKPVLVLGQRGAEIVRGFAKHSGLRKPLDQY